ncbi:MAG: helix-turn-helix domain-containing protein [Sodaliphilus sp.]
MENFIMLSDTEITKRISKKLKWLRLKQNISRRALSHDSGVSVSSIARMEDGEIKSFESFIRILRMLGKLHILQPLVEDEPISPIEYFNMMQAAKPKKQRQRASKVQNNNPTNISPKW